MRHTSKLLVVAAAVAMLVAAVASAAPGKSISMTFTMHFTGATTAEGTWVASGDLPLLAGKSGTVQQKTRITGKGKGKGHRSGLVVHGRKLVTASDGTFVIQFVGPIKPTGATTSTVDGRFVIKHGTGAYKGLHATGKIHAELNSATGAIVATYTGMARVSHS